MIAEYEGGCAPDCQDCRRKVECDFAGTTCGAIDGFNIRLGLLAQIAAIVRQDHNHEVREAVAGALIDTYGDYFPSGWLDEADFREACGVARHAVAA